MAEKIYYVRHHGGLTLFKDGRQAVVSNEHPNFDRIIVALKERNFDLVETLMSVARTINKAGIDHQGNGRIFVRGGKVFWLDSKKVERELHGTLVERILQDLGKPSFAKFGEALIKFLDNTMKNKLKDIRQELYEFLMSGKTPITYDGCFLAYKKVRRKSDGSFVDIHTGTMNNSVGEIVRMKQDDVDTNRHNTCSRGLHFCSLGYLDHYSGGYNDAVVIVKVNPRHVFAIPTDYQFQKGRASEYFVVGEYKGWDQGSGKEAFKDAFVDEDTKAAAAPEVEFQGWLRPSLQKLAESYGLCVDGKVLVATRRDRLIPVKALPDGSGFIDIIGTPIVPDELKTMSIETKSVRELVKGAINKATRGKSDLG
jgi:hypothetical protein